MRKRMDGQGHHTADHLLDDAFKLRRPEGVFSRVHDVAHISGGGRGLSSKHDLLTITRRLSAAPRCLIACGDVRHNAKNRLHGRHIRHGLLVGYEATG